MTAVRLLVTYKTPTCYTRGKKALVGANNISYVIVIHNIFQI